MIPDHIIYYNAACYMVYDTWYSTCDVDSRRDKVYVVDKLATQARTLRYASLFWARESRRREAI